VYCAADMMQVMVKACVISILQLWLAKRRWSCLHSFHWWKIKCSH